MPRCDFCRNSFSGTKGLSTHLNKCAVRLQHLQSSAAAAVAIENTRIQTEASNAAVLDQENIVEQPPIEPPREPSPLPPGPGGRPRRRPRLPARFRDDAPDPPTPIPPPPREPDPVPEPQSPQNPARDGSHRWVKTEPNAHGVYKVFPNRPTHDPEDSISLDDLCRSPDLLTSNTVDCASTPKWFPFLNATVARLMMWFHLGSNLKSIAELDSLISDVLLHEDFKREHLEGFSTARENKRLDDATNVLPGEPPSGWINSSVKIKLPAPKVCTPEKDAAEFEVHGILYRPLLDVMREAFEGPAFLQYHTTPFELRWDPNHDPAEPPETVDEDAVLLDEHGLPQLPEGHEPVYGEIYTSHSMLREHNSLPQTAVPHLETIIAAYMFWSDSTHLANFGTASLWPLYTFFGNLSKYTRAKPSANAGLHQAYFPSLPDSLKDTYNELFGILPSAEVLTHLKRELMHAIWDLLLSPEFIHAYVHGLVVKCYDGVERRIFPRFFTYGADYPEKVLLATIKYFGGCPCPRCFVEKDQIPEMGTKADMRRRQNTRQDTSWWRGKISLVRGWIFEKGYLVAGAAVNRVLKPQSWVPTRNAFSKLAEFGFNLFSMFVPDLLHEVELGVVKSLFTHTLRLLQAFNSTSSGAIAALDARFREIPTFGRSTIRRFHANVSEMKKLAARDFEDILQVCLIQFSLHVPSSTNRVSALLPALEGLLPEPHNGIILTLWFTLATWHAYAKLRLHNGLTIQSFKEVNTVLGTKVRHFLRTTCEAYDTYELPKEVNRRQRREAQKNPASGQGASTAPSKKKRKKWNIATYKYHSFGDYPDTIVTMGTTDSYSTQISERVHVLVKKLYARTNKRNFGVQIAAHERRRRLLRRTRERMENTSFQASGTAPTTVPSTDSVQDKVQPQNDTLPRTPPRQHHHISESKRNPFDIFEFDSLSTIADDPAVEDFLVGLRAHLLCRLLGLPYDGDDNETHFASQDLMDVTFVRDRIYSHQVMRINYTTYDMQRDSDSLNPRTHPDIMIRSYEDQSDANPHPYLYARVLGVFHADIRHVGPRSNNTRPQRMEFLWVRWFTRDLSHNGGWKAKRLHRLEFVDSKDPDAFGFLDPAEVIRGAHIIPAFHYGRTSALLGQSIARKLGPDKNDEDYRYHYVNFFVDRDMFMRYFERGVGHRASTCSASAVEEPIDDDMDVDLEEPARHVDEDIPGADGPDPDDANTGEKSDLDDSSSEEENEGEGGDGEGDPTNDDEDDFDDFEDL